ncbi:MAG: hypothetical protein M3Y27_24770 [Acidobacteriota bacterium]|nr:hypothetical protein [Acidobacteriota bacterium]
MRPIHLGLFSGKGGQTQERLVKSRTQAHHRTAQLNDAAGVPTLASHLGKSGSRAMSRTLGTLRFTNLDRGNV